jgi:subtilase family protein
MPDGELRLHPHIFAPAPAESKDFTSPKSGRGNLSIPGRQRTQHADHLLGQLHSAEPVAAARAEEQRAEGIDEGNGVYLVFKSTAGFDLKFESLDVANSGIELCTVRTTAEGQTEATVFVPDGKLTYFLNKVSAYRNEDGKPSRKTGQSKPKNQDLVASIGDIQLAALQSLWTDLPELYPLPQQDLMWEVWLRRNDGVDHVARLRQHAEKYNLTVSREEIVFIDRTIILVHGNARNLSRSNDILGAIAEVRLAKTTASFFTQMNAVDQQAWIDDLIARAAVPANDAPYICLLDTGINRGHPLLASVTHDDDVHTYNPNWGANDRFGHGTPMAGLAVYGDLADALGGGGAVRLTHRIESVKVFNDQDPHAKELYGAVTQECVSRVEVRPDRTRIFCMAVTTSDNRDRGRPSSWSAAIDAMTSGFSDGERRLMIIAAGNTDTAQRRDYPSSNHTDAVHDPAQAWNAVTVGGCTEKAFIDQTRFAGWQPVAPAGDLSPCSCTSMTWSDTKWPIKPDIVLEAGNMGRHERYPDPDYIDDALSLLSTPHDFARGKPLVTFGDTSAATGLAARMAGIVWAKYPRLTPEAVRALIVHSASWTPAMRQRFTNTDGTLDLNALFRCFGFGIPNLRELLSSADNSLTLIVQDTIQPFHKDDKSVKYREMRLHALPWPREVLEELQDTEVTLRITLSYFVEPNPGARGWSTKYGYQSHGLRFDVKRATENLTQFQQRINKASWEAGPPDDSVNETGSWLIKNNQTLAALGSIRSNIWTGPAADLAARGFIAVYPTYGWWNKRPNLKGYEKSSHYALIATIKTPETDIYTPVATAINLPILIET